jgi:hypothetical protein
MLELSFSIPSRYYNSYTALVPEIMDTACIMLRINGFSDFVYHLVF